MNRQELDKRWSDILRSDPVALTDLENLAQGVVDVYSSGDLRFKQHIKNRSRRVAESTGQAFDTEVFDIDMARAFVADELGFRGWNELAGAVETPSGRPMLFQYAVAALERGDFSALESRIGGPQAFDAQVKAWLDAGYLAEEPEAFAEMFAAACMLGHGQAAAALLDAGVDPYAGMRTGLAGFHYAASSGRLNIIKLLIARGIPMEVENMYGGTVLGQALWSAVNEHTPDHAAIVEALIDARGKIEPGTLSWWERQQVPSTETKERVAAALKRHG
ncbi:MAG TPA: ankyrin repeat domain-containing protein [Pyrinomonadaceae bacterium]|nr:ankyrin repeat domain-containing protein [Pyrinomonadaceae bacterium]